MSAALRPCFFRAGIAEPAAHYTCVSVTTFRYVLLIDEFNKPVCNIVIWLSANDEIF